MKVCQIRTQGGDQYSVCGPVAVNRGIPPQNRSCEHVYEDSCHHKNISQLIE